MVSIFSNAESRRFLYIPHSTLADILGTFLSFLNIGVIVKICNGIQRSRQKLMKTISSYSMKYIFELTFESNELLGFINLQMRLESFDISAAGFFTLNMQLLAAVSKWTILKKQISFHVSFKVFIGIISSEILLIQFHTIKKLQVNF